MFNAGRQCQRLPMRDTATCLAVDRAQRSVTPDVLGSGLWMSLYLHGAEFEVNPRSTYATAQGTVATRCDRWSCGQCHSNCATVARAFVRGHFADVAFWEILGLQRAGGNWPGRVYERRVKRDPWIDTPPLQGMSHRQLDARRKGNWRRAPDQ